MHFFAENPAGMQKKNFSSHALGAGDSELVPFGAHLDQVLQQK